ncbi:HAD family hydrolase [Streptomyces sp. NPDC008001]|uniref:HAD family hydrolase n=1 Tax=Streptomyces sp. NPDC008001 TaxID=3364804 RepID=UPI0036F0CC7F
MFTSGVTYFKVAADAFAYRGRDSGLQFRVTRPATRAHRIQYSGEKLKFASVLFDLAGTLTVPMPPMDPDEPWRRYVEALAGENAEDQLSRLREAEMEAFRAGRDEQRSFTFGKVLELAGIPWTPEGVAAYRGAWEPYTRVPPETVAVLAALQSAGVPMGLLSNTIWPVEWHREALVRDGVDHFFTATVFSSELAVAKPHPDAFRALLARLGDPPAQECLFVGDRAFEDVSGAAAVGMSTALLPDSSVATQHRVAAPVEPTYRVASLAGLLDIVDH